jgi:hypothetical protein
MLLLRLAAAAVTLPLGPITFVPGLNWSDKICQAIKTAHRLLEAVLRWLRLASS